jgi:NAD+ kinase
MPESTIKKVAILVKPEDSEAFKTGQELSAWLKGLGIEVIGEPLVLSKIADSDSPSAVEAGTGADLIVVLGGDGTMISAARLVGDRQIPVIGINYGGLGYLTEFRIEEIHDALETVLRGEFVAEERAMLEVEHINGGNTSLRGKVLNDVVINKTVLARIIEIDVSLNGEFVNRFRADGLIIATPTGSTAYNLSAGGPIIHPGVSSVVITPICPFTLTNRPLVVCDDSEIEVCLRNESDGVMLTLDGQVGAPMKLNDRLRIRKSKTVFKLIRPTNRNYFDVLRSKLKWG